MCLSEVYSNTEMEAWLADQPEVIEVRKYAVRVGATYTGIFRSIYYESGLNIAGTGQKITPREGRYCYWSGFHFDVTDWFCARAKAAGYTPLKCLIKKSWITAVGIEGGDIVLVASRAVFPHYPETEARREDIEPFLEKKVEVKDEVSNQVTI